MTEIRELSEDEVRRATVEHGDTTRSDLPSNIFGEEWEDRVIEYSRPLRRMRDLSRVKDISGQGKDTVRFFLEDSRLDISVSQTALGQGNTRTFTKLDSLSERVLSFDETDFYKGGIAIPKESVMTSNVDLVKTARMMVSEAIAQDVDEAILKDVVDAIEGNNGEFNDYSGDASHDPTIIDQSSSGVLTPDAVAKGMREVEKKGFSPFAMVISPSMKYDLRTDSQFTNAEQYGSDEVVLNGEIGKYLGLKIVESENISTKAPVIGTKRSGQKVGPALGILENPHIDYQYNKPESEHRIYYDQAFKPVVLQRESMTYVKTA